MTIHDVAEKIKPFYTLILLVVVATLFFALGRFSALEEKHVPIRVYNPSQNGALTGSAVEATLPNTPNGSAGAVGNTPLSATIPVAADTTTDGQVIGSKSGKKYYYPWCGTIKRVKPENQVFFASIAAARAAGYVPGGNCKGLK